MTVLLFILFCTITAIFIIGKLIEKHHKDIKSTLMYQIEQEEKRNTGQLRRIAELGRELDEKGEPC